MVIMKRSSFKQKRCKDHPNQHHTSWNCPYKPRTVLKKASKPMKWESPKTRTKRLQTEREWLELNPGPMWSCYLRIVPGCLVTLTKETLNIEHPDSKARRPDLKYVAKKLKPACGPCNKFKGSLSEAEARKKAKEIYG